MPLEPTEQRKVGRAIWGYSGLDQKKLAAKAGITYNRLRAALNDDKKSPPSTDELLALAKVAEVPAAFAINGWPSTGVIKRLERLEQGLSRLGELVPAGGGGAPAPGGELAHRLQEQQTNGADPEQQDSDGDTDAQTGSEQ